MAHEISVGIPGLTEMQRRLKAMGDLAERGDEGIMKEAAVDAMHTIKRLTEQGVDCEGNTFQPYADSTRRSPEYQGKARVDLEQSGRMIRAIRSEAVDGTTARVYVANTQRGGDIGNYNLAMVHNEGMRSGRGKGFQMPKREFFGISDANAVKILKKAAKSFAGLFAKMFRGGGR